MSPFWPTYEQWRVQSGDGIWHRPAWHVFHYAEARNENRTHCGLTLNNPPFCDLTPEWGHRVGPKSVTTDPTPACSTCATNFRSAMRHRAEEEVRRWS